LALNAPNGKQKAGVPIMRKTSRKYGCPVEFSVDILSGKWKTVILSRLKLRPMRYGELRHDIPALSDKVLTERLRDLRDEGFVKQDRSGRESRYRLTTRGEMLRPMLQALYDWGEDNAASFDVRFPNAEDN
jgi:DNA-binding HxlR family transcriptional regulator